MHLHKNKEIDAAFQKAKVYSLVLYSFYCNCVNLNYFLISNKLLRTYGKYYTCCDGSGKDERFGYQEYFSVRSTGFLKLSDQWKGGQNDGKQLLYRLLLECTRGL